MWAETATYTWTYSSSKFTVKGTGDVPQGSSATLTSTYSNANQLTGSKAQTFTLSGYDGCTITGVSINMKRTSNSSAKANITITANGQQIGSESNLVLTQTATDYSIDLTSIKVDNGKNIVITVGAAANSIYVYNYVITYTASGKTALSTATNLASFNITGTTADLSWDAVSNASGYKVKVGSKEYETNTNSISVIGLDELTTYSWSVKALAGTSDTYSDGVYSSTSNFTTGEFVVAAGTYNIYTNSSLYGVSNGNNGTEQSISKCGVTVVSGCSSSAGSKTYYDAGHVRYYVDSYLKLTAPSGYAITKVVFSEPSTDKKWDATESTGITVNSGVYTHSNKTWEGLSSQVNFSFSKQCRIASITVTYVEAATITLNSACTDGVKVYGTYSNGSNWVVPSDLTVSEVCVVDGELAIYSYNEGDVVPANAGVMVSAKEGDSYTVTLTNATATASPSGGENSLVGTGNGITAAEMAQANTEFFRLTMHNGTTIGFWWGAENGAAFALGANKAYLAVATDNLGLGSEGGNVKESLWFGDNVTAIKGIANELQNKVVYNLNGQRVSKAQKGLYIVNGKKYLVK